MNMDITEFARMGGNARAKALSKDRRKEIARNAGLASGLKRKLASKLKQCQVPESVENK